MKSTLSVLTLTALAAFVPAQAASLYTVDFTGVVYQTVGSTGHTIGDTVSGHFDLNGATGKFLDYTIAGRSVAPGYLSFASIGPALFDAIYTAQLSPVALGSPNNSSFSLDLSTLSSWPGTDTAFTLLADTTQLATNLDTATNPLSTFPSTFDYYTAGANGTGVTSLAANLSSISVASATITPEPATLTLVAASLLGLAALVRRRA